MTQPRNPVLFLRTTAIGGLLFLLPLIVIGALIGQVAPIVMSIVESLGGLLPGFLKTPQGLTLLVVLAIIILLILCFGAGLLARWSLSKRLSEVFEKNLLLLFPRYAILKEQMADSIGGEALKPKMKPVLVRLDDLKRVGFETERNELEGLVTVYLPGSPDAWSGMVALVSIDRVEKLNADFGDLVTTCEQLGRGTIELIGKGAKTKDS